MKALTEVNPEIVEKCADMLKVIAHPIRMTIVELLHHNNEMTVTELYRQMGVEQAVASHHLALLRNKNIITSKRSGKNVLYELRLKKIHHIIHCIKECGLESVENS